MSEPNEIPAEVEEILRSCGGTTSRRQFLKGTGLLLLSFSGAGTMTPFRSHAATRAAPGAGPYPDPDFRQLDSWIAIHEDGTATFFVGKTDGGQGVGTALRQMMSDELDIAFADTSLVMGRTDLTVDQGGSGGSDALERDGRPARRVAAEARRALLELASQRLGVPVERLAVRDGVVWVAADPSRRVTYGELVGGKRFHVTLTGNNVDSTTGQADVKPVQEFRVIGRSLPRYDIPPKVDGSLEWAVDVAVPGMVHARNVKPPVAGARLVRIDESSVRDLPGFVRVVNRGNYVAVVCQREEQAIQAARRLVVEWETPASAPFPASDDLFAFLRAATPTSLARSAVPRVVGDPDAALANAATVIEASYDFPFQGHTAIGPAHAVADPSDGQMTIYSNDMKAYSLRTGVAEFLGMPRDQVRVVWMEGPQVYGRTAADDAGFEAAFLAKEIGRPVRVQWMRDEETAWDTKGPAFTFDMRGGLDAEGNLVGWEYRARVANYGHLGYNQPDTVLIAQLMGIRPSRPAPGGAESPAEAEMYSIPNRRQETHVVRLPLAWETPLRTGNLRDPSGVQTTFASESFIDELAAAAKSDPVEFRLRLLRASSDDDEQFKRARSIAVVEAAAKEYGWDARASPRPLGPGTILTGRGMAYGLRSQTVVAVIAEVEVNRETGRVWVKRFVCAQDCGLVVNPDGLRRCVEGNLLHGLSRALHEEVRFDGSKVTSVDWVSHPTLRHTDTPERIDFVSVNGDPDPDRPDLRPYGSGEMAIRVTVAAVANAIHDATGVRIRRPPFRDERVLAALRAAGI